MPSMKKEQVDALTNNGKKPGWNFVRIVPKG